MEKSIQELEAVAKNLRRDIVTMIAAAGSGHPGGSLSAVEFLTALYFKLMKHDPKNPHWEDRDRFVLSKGHAAPVLYATLAECGYFPKEELQTLRQLDSILQGHTDRTLTPGVELSAGSLGQGLSFAVGVALAGRLDKKDYTVYALLGDGECDEGQVWEAAMSAAHFKVDNLVAIVDKNGLQIDGWTKDVMNTDPMPAKWQSFGWEVFDIDGNSMAEVVDTLEKAKQVEGRPAVIVARTIKGKGVSFMENQAGFHGKAPGAEQLEQALKELA